MKRSGIFFAMLLLRFFEFSHALSNSAPKWRRHISKPAGLMSMKVLITADPAGEAWPVPIPSEERVKLRNEMPK